VATRIPLLGLQAPYARVSARVGWEIMSERHLYLHETKQLTRIAVLKELISEQDLEQVACPLLDAQLDKILVLVDTLLTEIHKMQAELEKTKS
jgi:hypothetical protein